MILLWWTLAAPLLLLGSWLLVLNWGAFWVTHIRRSNPAPSWIPLLPGLLLCGGLAMAPLSLGWLCTLPLLLDWGAIPGITYTVLWHARRTMGRDEQS